MYRPSAGHCERRQFFTDNVVFRYRAERRKSEQFAAGEVDAGIGKSASFQVADLPKFLPTVCS